MALNNLLRFSEVVPLIPGTGVQFLDFGFSIGKQSHAPQVWGYFDPRTTLNDGKVPSCVRRGDDEEARGVESYEVDLKAIVQAFDRSWVPLPLLRKEAGGFFRGPTNWARAYLAKLDAPDADGNEYRLVLAIDTSLMAYSDTEAYLAPSPDDARNGRQFQLPDHKTPLDWFVGETWVRDWCLEAFRDMLEREQRRRRALSAAHSAVPTDAEMHDQMQGSNEHLARYKAFIDLLHSLDIIPPFKLVDRITEPRTPPIDVDLVLDLGNSRSCGLLIESISEQLGIDISKAVKLQLRDLGRCEQVYSDPFPSRFEFARASFGRDHLSIRSGRADAFAWPTVVRVGPEAVRLASQRSGAEGHSGLSSPKRYLWDEDPQIDSWRFNSTVAKSGLSDFATGVAFTTLVNDHGDPLHRIDKHVLGQYPDKGFPAIRALYSRRNLTAFALAEVFVQAISMMNSPMHRLRRPANANLPRRLRRIIMTLPTAMPLAERYILTQQAEAARDLAYLSVGLAEIVHDEDGSARIRYSPEGRTRSDQDDAGPQVILKWDEATATQAVYLYTQVALNYSGDGRGFFGDVRHPANRNDPATKDRLRLATIDLGGGTSDLVVTSIAVEGTGANVTLIPHQEFREGFNLAGDDALFKVVREFVVEPLRAKLRTSGLGDRADHALVRLVGADHGESTTGRMALRQGFASQVAAPIALAMLQEYEGYDSMRPAQAMHRPFGEFFTAGEGPSARLLGQINAELAKDGARDFRIEDMSFEIDLREIDRVVRSVFLEMLQALGEVVHRYRCDVLILSGRTSRLPAVRNILEESGSLPSHRIVALHQFRVGAWYPYPDFRGTVGDPKTTAAVGAMICLLGNGQLLNFNFRSEALRPRNTARYFGKLGQFNRLLKADEFIDNLDLDNVDYEPPDRAFEFRGPMALGFRQLPVDWWPATRLYSIEYRTDEDANALNAVTPLHITLKRAGRRMTNKADDEQYIENPELQIAAIKNRDDRTVPVSRLRLRLQTLNDLQGYWLDTGVLI